MPELPEVETVRRGLQKKLTNFIIKKVEILRDSTVAYPKDNKEFIKGLNNSLILNWERRGKYLIASLKKIKENQNNVNKTFDDNGFLIVHLRMTGHFNFINHPKKPCKHTRVRFFDNKQNELRYIDIRCFGQMWWVKNGIMPREIIKGLALLGPEPFSKEFNTQYLKKIFKNRKRSIKSVLLDQTLIAGIGNIYADESLYSAGISPFREAKTIKFFELKKLKESIIKVLKKSIGSGGTTFSDFRDLEGLNGNYGMQANVYRRTGKECRKCKNIIQRKKISGRSTHWCGKCQK